MKTRIRIRRRVLTWFVSRWRNHQFKQAEKPHSKFSARKTLDGPATRPKTPLAVENSVGKLAAPPVGAPNASTGKRAWRTPIPHLVPVRPQGWAGTLCFGFSLLILIFLYLNPPRSRLLRNAAHTAARCSGSSRYRLSADVNAIRVRRFQPNNRKKVPCVLPNVG